jgi:hypothetical protein
VTVLISSWAAQQVLNGLPKLMALRLHHGNPGPEGKENGSELTFKESEYPLVTEATAAAGRKNNFAMEWEVKVAETLKFISLFDSESGKFVGYAELSAPKSVEPGNVFKLPVGSIVILA